MVVMNTLLASEEPLGFGLGEGTMALAMVIMGSTILFSVSLSLLLFSGLRGVSAAAPDCCCVLRRACSLPDG